MPEPANSNVKQTPGRRRSGSNAARASAQKHYASENDAAAADPNFQPDFTPRRRHGPRTPKKGASKGNSANPTTASNATSSANPGSTSNNGNPGNPGNPQPVSGKANKRNSGKNYPKNISTSPAPPKPGRRTPPQTAGAKPTGTSTAFAGATFHASPAPASLPLPSFFTKPNSPDTPQIKTVTPINQEPSPPASDSETQSGKLMQALPHATASARDSPLDIFFRADRAEKDRARRTSASNIYAGTPDPLSPSPQVRSPLGDGNLSFPRSVQQQPQRRPLHARHLSSGISVAELNGDGPHSETIGPAFATPFQERLRAARPMATNGYAKGSPVGFRDIASPPNTTPAASLPSSTDERTEALKRYLFAKTAIAPKGTANATNGTASPGSRPASAIATATVTPTPTRHTRGQSLGGSAPRPAGFGPSAFANIYSSPAAASKTHVSNEAANIAAMENSLRQILNLGSGSPFSATSQAGYAQHR